ncbi:uncharacterized protein MELLADRAFT_112629 [Melampsora larici-populina 98AG31]|uniref:SGNH hydrolase-type esterase domain-containing protein n=1 Tax=Melampsora larici-populina (strain 98AG31 / pathotype 3-4-7) TaxID=747676 RepID=F4S733_MELLP|nr:uncharacterized protein MELLADRAFT_112629 [Melampsora larici-populina 98AG31]EGF99579.1 hypothetical protein MELLADRAFT_112629 [Melampsora larici-populina 98AG31]
MTSPMFLLMILVLMAMPRPGQQGSINTSPLRLAAQPSYMSNGQTFGTTPAPAVQRNPNDPHFGGRASNGLVWVEQFGNQIGAVVKNYAAGGASVSRALSPSDVPQTDMIGHVRTFLNQRNHVDASSSMAMISYGINDWASSSRHGTQNLPKAAQELVRQTELLVQAGIRNVVVLSPPMMSGPLVNFNNIIWNGLKALRNRNPAIQFAYVDFTALYSAITSNPRSFGYLSTSSCLPSATSMSGACSNPNVYLYYLPRHPQKLTHGLMAEWVQGVLSNCRS